MQKIVEAAGHVLEFISDIPLADSSIRSYGIYYRHSIFPYCEANHIEIFTDDAMRGYVEEQMSEFKDGDIGYGYMVKRRRAAALLADFMQNRPLDWRRKNYAEVRLCEPFEAVVCDYLAHISQSLSSRTIQDRKYQIRRFLVFLEEKCGVLDLHRLTPENVRGFIAAAVPTRKASMRNLIGAVKDFLSYMDDSGLAAINAERYLTNPASRRRKLLPCFTDDETEAILNSVDRSTPLGKRDYAIMKTALWTGLRGSDIIDLKRSDIDWNHKVINVVQNKTGVCVQSILSSGVGNAIADYIMNGRPDTDIPYIFVRHIVPYDRLRGFDGRQIISRYLEKAGVFHEAGDGKTFHAFRRTMGTRLVRAGVPILSVSEMLGHLDPNLAKSYIALDNQGLRVCCMDISAFRTGKEGLE